MKKTLLAIMAAFAFPSAGITGEWSGPLQGIDKKVLAPAYQSLAQGADNLAIQASKLCQSPNEEALKATQTAFQQNVKDWQAVQWLNFGPVTLFMRYYGFEYWPDKKGLTQRQLNSLLSNDTDTSAEEFWHSASIAVRGLTAMESILYRPKLNPLKHPENCTLLENIAGHHLQSSRSIGQEWSASSASEWIYYDEDEGTPDLEQLALEQMLQQWIEHMSVVKESKLETPVGHHGTRANYRLAEFYLSQSSVQAIRVNIDTYQALYHAGTPSLYEIAKQQAPELAASLEESLSRSAQLAADLPNNLFAPEYTTEQQYDAVMPLVTTLSSGQKTLVSLVTQLGFQIGFNSRDGD